MIAVTAASSFVINDTVNVRVVLAAILYPTVFVTAAALLVWRAKFWRFSFDVRLLFFASLLLTSLLFAVVVSLIDDGHAEHGLWGVAGAGESVSNTPLRHTTPTHHCWHLLAE